MKKAVNIIYVVICLAICLVPFAGMTVAKTDTTTENRRMAEFPKFMTEGKPNIEYLSELGDWFEDHFAFRPWLVMADSVVQSKVFGVSNMDTVCVGKEGWLYYTSTIPDYLGTEVLSDAGLHNAVRNIDITRRIVEDKGAAFLLVIPPNKNTIYGEQMPYYDSCVVNETSNLELLEKELSDTEISYVNLRDIFDVEKEILYMKRDSHWNGKGAVLAYNAIMDSMLLDHDTYETVPVVRKKDAYGDLNKMIYPISYESEWDYYYQKENEFAYVSDTESVEDAWIETVNDNGNNSLLMFRDSFGNTLLPLMADVFEHAYFSKAVPYGLGKYMEQYNPEYVVIEKVERNISDFAYDPPVVTGPEIKLQLEDNGGTAGADAADKSEADRYGEIEKVGDDAIDKSEVDRPGENEEAGADMADEQKTGNGDLDKIEISECESDTDYWRFSGTFKEALSPEARIYIMLTTSDGSKRYYEAFRVSDADSDYGYVLYADKKLLYNGAMDIKVYVDDGSRVAEAASVSFDPTLPVE